MTALLYPLCNVVPLITPAAEIVRPVGSGFAETGEIENVRGGVPPAATSVARLVYATPDVAVGIVAGATIERPDA